MRRALLWLLALAGAGCNLGASARTPVPDSSPWGDVFTIAQVEQAGAPAVLAEGAQLRFAWIGADDSGVHQDMRLLADGRLSDRAVLPLPPVHPFAQQLAPAGLDGAHLLWLDADPAAPDPGLRLFTAYVNPLMQVERGPIRVSDRLTLRYASISSDDGSLWVVWSGGLQSEPSLFAQSIDLFSRPRQPQVLVSNADWPALVRSNDGSVYVFWIDLATRQTFRATLGDGVMTEQQAIGTAPTVGRGERMVGMSAGLDRAGGYLFWNVVRADRQVETWFAWGALDAAPWSAARRLGVDWTTKALFETGYNSGAVFPAWPGDHWLRWATPAASHNDVLPLAAQVGDGLAVIYLRGGEVGGYQEITRLNSALIGLPALATNRTRHLYLAWSEPHPDGYADLKFTTTQRTVNLP